MSIVGKWFSIECYKHDGSLHRVWDRGLVLENTSDYLVVATKNAKVVEFNGRRWFTNEPAVTIFSKKEWWNAICMLKKDGVCFYCNIASPTLISGGTIKYIDYDLDAKFFPSGDIKILDEKEYLRHKNKYGYSKELDEVIRFELDEVLRKMKAKQFPFQSDLIKDYYDDFLKRLGK